MASPVPRFPYQGRCGGVHTSSAALRAELLTTGYEGVAEPALREVSLEVRPGTRVALVGANGAGKSALLGCAAGLLKVRSGSLTLFGHAPGACRHQVAYLPQRADLDWSFPVTVRQLVLAGRFVHLGWFSRPGAADKASAEHAMKLLGLSDVAGRHINELSGGQQQRALLARALVHEADLLLLDEPLNAVDTETRGVIAGVLDDLRANGRTVIMATHDLGRLDRDFDEAVFLHEGRRVSAPPGSCDGQHGPECHHDWSRPTKWSPLVPRR